MSDALEEHDEKVGIDERNISNLRFANGKYALAEEELKAIVESFDKARTRCKMEIIIEKTKQTKNSAHGSHR
ncbi:MAG: hypothetical protein AB2693_33215, partial [Candidatus Thiodiazotropha sp.]